MKQPAAAPAGGGGGVAKGAPGDRLGLAAASSGCICLAATGVAVERGNSFLPAPRGEHAASAASLSDWVASAAALAGAQPAAGMAPANGASFSGGAGVASGSGVRLARLQGVANITSLHGALSQLSEAPLSRCAGMVSARMWQQDDTQVSRKATEVVVHLSADRESKLIKKSVSQHWEAKKRPGDGWTADHSRATNTNPSGSEKSS